MPIPNANQSKGQDGVLAMAFDPDFNNTHHIYVAYTYEEDSGEGIPDQNQNYSVYINGLPIVLASH